jgi:aerobic-type carbon monoxide dehydrogenase small subunit (CoxS/CutS family)
MACVTLAARVAEPVETAEGLADEAARLREAFADRGAFQCGFCTPGQLVRAVAVLRAGVPESDAELRRELSGNLCRCTGYQAIVEAVRSEENA